jgi:hypothetical protein
MCENAIFSFHNLCYNRGYKHFVRLTQSHCPMIPCPKRERHRAPATKVEAQGAEQPSALRRYGNSALGTKIQK